MQYTYMLLIRTQNIGRSILCSVKRHLSSSQEAYTKMEALPQSILDFNPNTLKEVRKEFNLDQPGRIEEAIDLLEDWVKKQHHFTKKNFSREYLEITLITTKGLVERAKTRIDKLCTFKTLMPQFFMKADISDYVNLHQSHHIITHGHPPKVTKDNYRVYIFKLNTVNFESSAIFEYYKYLASLSEYLKIHDYCVGFVLLLDFTEVNILNLVTKINLVDLRHVMTLITEGYGMRVKNFHIITPSKMVDALVSLFKQVLSEKLGQRIIVHKTIDTLYEYVERDILPVEYGGNAMSLKEIHDLFIKTLTSKEHIEYMKEMNHAKTDESFRQADKFNEQYISMPGSFRTLSVD